MLAHPRAVCLLHPAERRDDVPVEDVSDDVGVHLDQRAEHGADRGVVHEHVEPAEGRDRRLDGGAPMLGVAGVAGDRHDLSRAAERRCDLVQALRMPRGQNEPMARSAEGGGDRPPDAAARARHQGHRRRRHARFHSGY